ncbi:hypothetical protein D5F51_09800 [Yersinia hibernica]|uniref:Uncharacterized protein n=1 Tax=Yersinia hibernica TaxID=2339259 RepID=A0ABX5QZS0_9GAMM|nr:hypothetical protein D5F51_09800 [Yersinia hibernica]
MRVSYAFSLRVYISASKYFPVVTWGTRERHNQLIATEFYNQWGIFVIYTEWKYEEVNGKNSLQDFGGGKKDKKKRQSKQILGRNTKLAIDCR